MLLFPWQMEKLRHTGIVACPRSLMEEIGTQKSQLLVPPPFQPRNLTSLLDLGVDHGDPDSWSFVPSVGSHSSSQNQTRIPTPLPPSLPFGGVGPETSGRGEAKGAQLRGRQQGCLWLQWGYSPLHGSQPAPCLNCPNTQEAETVLCAQCWESQHFQQLPASNVAGAVQSRLLHLPASMHLLFHTSPALCWAGSRRQGVLCTQGRCLHPGGALQQWEMHCIAIRSLHSSPFESSPSPWQALAGPILKSLTPRSDFVNPVGGSQCG